MIEVFLNITTYFGSFNLSCDPVLARWAALLPTASNFSYRFKDYTGSALGAKFIGAGLPLFIAFSN